MFRPRPALRKDEDLHAIAARLRVLRLTTGLSQQAFAERFGLGYKMWGNIESARARPSIDSALILAKRMRVPLDWIFMGETAFLPAHLAQQIETVERAEQQARPRRGASAGPVADDTTHARCA